MVCMSHSSPDSRLTALCAPTQVKISDHEYLDGLQRCTCLNIGMVAWSHGDIVAWWQQVAASFGTMPMIVCTSTVSCTKHQGVIG